MKNEIKDNEYIRTDTGKIDKVINTNYYMPQYIECEKDLIFKNNIVKHSPNLIDLIECGDYVNGKEVKHIADFEGIEQPIRKVIFVDETHLIPGETAENEDIKTIVTKEQIEFISYKIKGVNDEN